MLIKTFLKLVRFSSVQLLNHVSDAIRPSHPLFPLLRLPSIFPSISVFSNESALRIRWPKYWSFSFSISPSNEYSGLISLRIDWFEPLAVQGTLKSLLQHHNSKASILWLSALLMVYFSYPYMTTGTTSAMVIYTLTIFHFSSSIVMSKTGDMPSNKFYCKIQISMYSMGNHIIYHPKLGHF